MEKNLVKFIMGMKAECPPHDTPFLDLYYSVFSKSRNKGLDDLQSQEKAVQAVVKHLLN